MIKIKYKALDIKLHISYEFLNRNVGKVIVSKRYFFYRGVWVVVLGAIFLRRLVVPFPNIVITLSRTILVQPFAKSFGTNRHRSC